MSLYQAIMGHPWVYNYLRPAMLGGVNYTLGYSQLQPSLDDVILDFGCGYGDALRYIRVFKEYHGFDIDHRAIEHIKRAYGTEFNSHIHTYARTLNLDDVLRIKPTRVIIAGALHHLSDTEIRDLFAMLASPKTVQQILTIDVVFLPGQLINNALASLDRGKHVRDIASYISLVNTEGFSVRRHSVDYSNRFARYLIMDITGT
jgi:hypothetical protein